MQGMVLSYCAFNTMKIGLYRLRYILDNKLEVTFIRTRNILAKLKHSMNVKNQHSFTVKNIFKTVLIFPPFIFTFDLLRQQVVLFSIYRYLFIYHC